jgi:hypothetical protein
VLVPGCNPIVENLLDCLPIGHMRVFGREGKSRIKCDSSEEYC